MNTTVKISVDRTSLITTISIEPEDIKIITELKIFCQNVSDNNWNYLENKFTIPWYEFRRGLNGIAMILKNESASVQLDSFATVLIQNVIDDKKSVKEKISSINLSESQLVEILRVSGFSRPLNTEQERDCLKLLHLKHGANFSVPGAGKTAAILGVYTVLKHLGIVSKLFVVAPINAFISWEDEIGEIFKEKKFTIRRLETLDLQNISMVQKENPEIILVNYEKLRKDVNQLVKFFLSNDIHLILDESHRVKSGMNNLSYNQIIKLADLAKRRDILSGTPMPQSYLDLEPQFDFLWPGEKIIPEQVNGRDESVIVANVNSAIEGLFVRTTKKELGLADPKIVYKSLPMGPIQGELYKLFKSETARIIAGIDKVNLYNFRRIGRSVVKLMQASTNPMLLTLKDDYDEEIMPVPKQREFWELLDEFTKYEKPSKIEYLKLRAREILDADRNNKVLIWSYFVRNIQILEKQFKEFNPVTIYGGIPTGSDEDEAYREGRIRKFHIDKDCRVMIANPQACGEGISLHRVCHHAIYLDRNFNAAFFLQSIDRIHRLGLEKNIETKVDILISENSIDELLILRLNEKIKMMGSVLEDPYLHSLAYDPADIPASEELGIDLRDFELIKAHVTKS